MLYHGRENREWKDEREVRRLSQNKKIKKPDTFKIRKNKNMFFFTKKINKLEKTISDLTSEKEEALKQAKYYDRRSDEKQEEINSIKKEHERETHFLEAVFASKERILRAELNKEIQDASNASKDENNTLKTENATLKKEVEILNKAFENMGFDVKDMKSILDKLVDGIVSGNKVNIIK